jgi:Na+-driven multidrug efflux pump
VAGVNDAFSQAVGQVFWLTVGAGVIAFIAALFLPDLVLRGARPSGEMADVIPGAEVQAEASGEEEMAG